MMRVFDLVPPTKVDGSMWLYIGSVEYGCDWVHVFEDVRVRASDR